jgi:regulator of sigma E protease
MPDFVVKTLAVVVLLGGLIFVHELGHYLVAKLLGVKVVRFSIGFGPRLVGVRWGETEYCVSALPLGGYVKMAGDDPTVELAPEDRGRGFLEQKPWRRLLIAAAGPLFNLLLPFLLIFGIEVGQLGEPTAAAVLGTVFAGSPAERAGLRPDDRIVSVAAPGRPARQMRQFGDLQDVVTSHPGETLVMEIEREGKPLTLDVLVGAEERSNGIEVNRVGVLRVSPYYAPSRVVPAAPGAAGPLQPFDLVVSAGGAPVKSMVALSRALAAAACGPVDLEVLRELPRKVPGAVLADYTRERLAGVPTCRDGKPTLLPADPYLSAAIGAVVPGGPAEQAGLRRGDVVTAVNGKPVHTQPELAGAVARELSPGHPGTFTLADGRTVTLTPVELRERDDLTGKETRRPTVGLSGELRYLANEDDLLARAVPLRRGLAEIAASAASGLVEQIRLMVLGLVMMFSGKISLDQVGGPIQIVVMTGQAVERGLSTFVSFMALISVNLGVMNLLPIPVLDGGHIVQAALETVTRRPLSLRAREVANVVGLVLLVALLLFASKNDIVRQLQGR